MVKHGIHYFAWVFFSLTACVHPYLLLHIQSYCHYLMKMLCHTQPACSHHLLHWAAATLSELTRRLKYIFSIISHKEFINLPDIFLHSLLVLTHTPIVFSCKVIVFHFGENDKFLSHTVCMLPSSTTLQQQTLSEITRRLCITW